MKLKSPLASQRELDKKTLLYGDGHADYRKLQSEIARAAAGERQPLAASRTEPIRLAPTHNRKVSREELAKRAQKLGLQLVIGKTA